MATTRTENPRRDARNANEVTWMKAGAGSWYDSCRRGSRGKKRLHSLAAIVRDYSQRHRPKTIRELKYFRDLLSLDAAITEAGLARHHDGKRHKCYSHQRRIPFEVLERATKRLRRANLKGADSFAELIERVRTAVRDVHGVRELYGYDTATNRNQAVFWSRNFALRLTSSVVRC